MMTDERKYKTFNSAEGRGISLTAALNWGPESYHPESAIYLRYGNPGSGTYASLSRDDTIALIEHLYDLVAAVDAAKPKEKTVPEKIEELAVGTIFSINERSGILFVRTATGTTSFEEGRPDGNNYPVKDFRGWNTLDIRLDPTK